MLCCHPQEDNTALYLLTKIILLRLEQVWPANKLSVCMKRNLSMLVRLLGKLFIPKSVSNQSNETYVIFLCSQITAFSTSCKPFYASTLFNGNISTKMMLNWSGQTVVHLFLTFPQ